MKMDIEGSEVDVLPDMLRSGAMSHIDTALIEFHSRLSKDQFRDCVLEDHKFLDNYWTFSCQKRNWIDKLQLAQAELGWKWIIKPERI